ncbi:hypothetical protein RAMLITH_23005 [Ramlibacter sp. RBP-2]|uniref:BstA-like C-terminal domain-containing protein n=1 Tax=Ramlibacter lithotrophicus TaxID=2606681 RepID=A0A7X6I8T2_9BURK|nr:hypothetical protein [Ramlibacter lithotrophicus]NKE68695.1 hypothetical protein [Ramlibacter lithotrophicus]
MSDDLDEPKGRRKGGLARAVKLSPEERAAIASAAAKKRWEGKPAAPLKPNKNKELGAKSTAMAAPLKQASLDLGIEIERDVGGVEMGVLENGMPYLTQRGLATITGGARSTIYDIVKEWEERHNDWVSGKDRISFFQKYLNENGFDEPTLHVETVQAGSIHYAYPDVVCMAFLEYYAFEYKGDNSNALANYRKFASFGLRRFIYEALGYSPEQKVLDSWRHFHDRVDMTATSVPMGYFSVFREIAIMLVPMIRAGIFISDKVVPDVSVGLHWSSHWEANDLDRKYGNRTRYDHEYPLYYPQSKSNPQPAFCYPEEALGAFRAWLQATYIRSKFPAYMLGQTRKGTVPLALANKALGAFGAQQLEAPKKRLK